MKPNFFKALFSQNGKFNFTNTFFFLGLVALVVFSICLWTLSTEQKVQGEYMTLGFGITLLVYLIGTYGSYKKIGSI